MDKEQYIAQSIETIKLKNLQTPFKISQASVVTNLEQYLDSLMKSYRNAKDPRIEQLFRDKIQQLIDL